MKGRFYVNSIKFNDGTLIPIENDDILIFVGSNNVGKSTAVKNIARMSPNHKVITHVTYKGDGTFEDFKAQLTPNGKAIIWPFTLASNIYIGSEQHLEAFWDSPTDNPMNSFDRAYLSTVNRLTLSNTQKPNTGGSPHPLHILKDNWQLEEEINQIFKLAFNTNIIVDRQNLGSISLHVGEIPKADLTNDPRFTEFYKAVRQAPLISTQGDGMRSFASILLELFTSNAVQIIIDEPESFLHPGQIKLLGQLIAKNFPGSQVLISTHSSDFIKGILDANSSRVKIIRITRDAEKNIPSVLVNDEIKATWSDPKLKHSSIIDGLFHETVVVCESDGDCRLFTAILNSEYEDDLRYYKIVDTYFVPSHGKDKIPSIVASLRKLSVPTYSICDFDLLNRAELLKRMLDAHGGDWNDIKADWITVNSNLGNKDFFIDKADILRIINDELDKIATDLISEKKLTSIKDSLKSKTAWANAKRYGIAALDQEDPRNSCLRILKYLKSIGIFVIHSGELESLDTSIPNSSKSEWLDAVLSQDLTDMAVLKDGKYFLKEIVDQIFPKE